MTRRSARFALLRSREAEEEIREAQAPDEGPPLFPPAPSATDDGQVEEGHDGKD